ncbi:signal transducing adapter molecule 1 [Trichonephila clavata]|uniref:Signal transducing adapter molecule 1 n=1 Tax=Trichonephila clavata TaxID=2740835 RepID=A0A8X6KJS7_TRICU|nr:signal transducing adapter molecule 1 [Trichonephila clavata]
MNKCFLVKVPNCPLPVLLDAITNHIEEMYGHIKCVQKLKGLLKKWTEEDFRNDPELSLIPSLYNSIKTVSERENQCEKDTHRVLKDTASSAVKKEEEDLAKAIELSLKESGSSPKVSSSLYPSTVSTTSRDHQTKPAKQLRKVRALYDFLAAEDNELSFKAGDIIQIIDDSDPSWFLGFNQNGQGLFPANFVTSDLSPVESLPAKEKKTVKFNEKVNVKTLGYLPVEEVVIDEKKIDEMLAALHDADPTGQIPDSDELLSLEDHCLAMGPLIEEELERIDHRHAALTDSNKFLVEALKSYEMLMKTTIPYVSFQVPSDIIHSNMYQTPALQFPQMHNSQTYSGEPYQSIPVSCDQFPVPLSGAVPTTLQSCMAQNVAQPQVPYPDISNPNSYGSIPPVNYSTQLPSREANGLYYGDLANSVQNSTTPISMHQPML